MAKNKVSQKHLFCRPEWFLAGISMARDEFIYLRTSERLLVTAAFHDGRSDLSSTDKCVRVSIDEALEWQAGLGVELVHYRLIAHTSFCGSSLLSRTLEGLPDCASYREPQVLVDLANLQASAHPICQQQERWAHILRFVLGQFRKTWQVGGVSVTKPSNWANNLLPQLSLLDGFVQLVLLDMDLYEYLIANLRGGKSRITYSLKLLNHYITEYGDYRSLIAQIEHHSLQPMGKLLRQLSVCFEIQKMLMDRSTSIVGLKNIMRMNKKTLVNQPLESLHQLARFWRIPVTPCAVEEAVAAVFPFHAKASEKTPWVPEDERNADEKIVGLYSNELTDTLRWWEQTFANGNEQSWGLKLDKDRHTISMSI